MRYLVVIRRLFLQVALLALVVGVSGLSSTGAAWSETVEDKEEIALSLARLLIAARAVVSNNQSLINDHTKGHKGFTAEVVIVEAKKKYEDDTGESIDDIDPATMHGRLLKAEMDSIAEVMNEAQDRINRPGIGFKGFLPAIFAIEVTEKFRARVGGIADLKLTAPAALVRNRDNMPDKWESQLINKKFRSSDHPMGEHVYGTGIKAGRVAFRLVLPEYYQESCLGCHGGPKGRRDITGGVKEGGELGDLGGAVSVVLFNAR